MTVDDTKVQHDIDPEVMAGFLDESEESIATLDGLFVELEQDPRNKEIIGNVFRVAHSIKGLAGFLGLTAIKELTHELETVLSNIRDDKLRVNSQIIDCLLAGFDELAHMLARVRAGQSQIEEKHNLAELIDQIKNLRGSSAHQEQQNISAVLADVSTNVAKISEQAEELDKVQDQIIEEATQKKPGADKSFPASVSGRSMRVSEEKIDVFMQYVGDLIEVSESFKLLQKRMDSSSDIELAKEFKSINSGFNQLSDRLQKSLLEIRKVPAKNLVQKVPRMARDLAQSLGKKIQVEITGQETQVDKSLIEALESPINHLVRNCVDHGIEGPEHRGKVGKRETGTIEVAIAKESENVIIRVRDDGGGIDPEKIRDKAVKLGLASTEQAGSMSDRQVLQFILSAGFSTAQKVTDVSGRGVGMDVVRSNVESLRGAINLESTLGEGTTVTLRMPSSLTVVVISGMVVSVGDQQYIIKLEDIHEVLRPRAQDVLTVNGKTECLKVRGQIYPLIRLHQVFGVQPEFSKPFQAMVILTHIKDKRAGMLVDRILGQQRVVLKELDKKFSYLKTIAGTAILANTNVGLVLDVPGIIGHSLGG